MPINTTNISVEEAQRIEALIEDHFHDLKAIEVSPGKMTRSLSAFANAEGGELYLGIDENKVTRTRSWRGFPNPEAANSFIQTFEEFFPLGSEFTYEFLQSDGRKGLVLHIDIHKSRDIRRASDGKYYVRRSAQNLPVDSEEKIAELRRNKGLISYETETVNVDPVVMVESDVTRDFIKQVVPHSEPGTWLRKQQCIVAEKPTVAGVLLYSDEPQALLPKRSGIKIYRYKTREAEGARESLDFDPISIEGDAYTQIHAAVAKTTQIIEGVSIHTSKGLEKVKYPDTALHEIITNAVLHRDYSIADDIHIKIYDNRVEVASPGSLPAHITPENILEERFARNGTIVRLINKFPDPPNKDIGEGLNTAFRAMRELKLKDPTVEQSGGYVTVSLRHERLASPEDQIMDYLDEHPHISNKGGSRHLPYRIRE